MFGPALDVAQSNLRHFGVRVGKVRRHLRGSVLPSVDLVQDVRQHEVPLAPPARSGSYAPQHGLLDGADGALCEVCVAPGHQEDPRALVAQQPQLRAAAGGRAVVGHLGPQNVLQLRATAAAAEALPGSRSGPSVQQVAGWPRRQRHLRCGTCAPGAVGEIEASAIQWL